MSDLHEGITKELLRLKELLQSIPDEYKADIDLTSSLVEEALEASEEVRVAEQEAAKTIQLAKEQEESQT